MSGFRIGSKVRVDAGTAATRVAVVRDYYPAGSSSHLFPHYVLKFCEDSGEVSEFSERTIVSTTRVSEYLE